MREEEEEVGRKTDVSDEWYGIEMSLRFGGKLIFKGAELDGV